MQQFHGQKTWLGRLVFSPDGRYLAAGTDKGTACRQVIQVWDTAGGDDPVVAHGTGFSDDPIAFSPDGRYLHLGWSSGAARLDLRTGAEEPDPSLAGQETLAFSADGRYALGFVPDPRRWSRKVPKLHLRLARWSPDGWAEVWKKTVPEAEDESKGRKRLRLSPDGSRAVRLHWVPSGAGWAIGIEVRAGESGKVVAGWAGGLPLYFTKAVVAPDAARVVALDERSFYVIDPYRPGSAPLKRVNPLGKHLTSAAFTPDGRRLVTTSNDAAATIWDSDTWAVRQSYGWAIGRLRSVAVSPDGLRAAAGSDQGRAVVWDLDL